MHFHWYCTVLDAFFASCWFFFITQVLLGGNGLSTNVSNTYLSKFLPKEMQRKCWHGELELIRSEILLDQLLLFCIR